MFHFVGTAGDFLRLGISFAHAWGTVCFLKPCGEALQGVVLESVLTLTRRVILGHSSLWTLICPSVKQVGALRDCGEIAPYSGLKPQAMALALNGSPDSTIYWDLGQVILPLRLHFLICKTGAFVLIPLDCTRIK